MISSAGYPYLVGCLLGLALYGVAAGLTPGQRKLSLLSGLVAVPCALSGVWMVPDYWAPKRVAVLLVGPEDVLFMFTVGGLAWLGTAAGTAPRVPAVDPRLLLRRLLGAYGFVALIGVGLLTLGLATMDAALGAVAAWVAYLLWRYPGHVPRALMTAARCTSAYGAFLLACALLWPEIQTYWNWEHAWGPRFAIFPVEEIAWAALFFPAWGLTMAHALDARFGLRQPAPRERARAGVSAAIAAASGPPTDRARQGFPAPALLRSPARQGSQPS